MDIYIWGTGCTFANASKQLPIDLSKITAYIDNNEKIIQFCGKEVIRPDQMCCRSYDAIIVLVGKSAADEIYKQCKSLNLEMGKIIFLEQNCYLYDLNINYDIIEQIFGIDYANMIKNKYRLIRSNLLEDLSYDEYKHRDMYESDYIRVKTLELVADEIKSSQIKGNIAELGVFRGDFAKHIHQMIPDKKLYLFDTFYSFDEAEASKEIEKGHINRLFFESYKETSIEECLSKMDNKNNICIKQGLFPDSLDGLEDVFSFVSIDVDLEQSIYKGLEYFYPRLSKGGYIFIHDYNSFLVGVRRAVKLYENKYNICMCKVPICDIAGTLVITKN